MRFLRRSGAKPALDVCARHVEGPPVPAETRVRGMLRDVRFQPETPNVALTSVTEDCEFVDADLSGWFSWDADIVGCRFAGRLHGVVFQGSDIDGGRRNEFRGNDFRDADLEDVGFSGGIDLDAQRLPSKPEYVRLRNVPKRVKRTCRKLERWPDPEERKAALEALDLFARVTSEEPDLFTKRDFIIEMADDPEVGRTVLELLEQG